MESNIYTKLVKSNLGLRSKEIIAGIIAEEKREEMKSEWEEIDKNKYQKFAEHIRLNGYLQIEIHNKMELITEIMKHFKDLKNAERKKEVIDLGDISKLSSVKKLKQNRELNELVSVYLNCPASCYRVNSWWQVPHKSQKDEPSNAQMWHRDRDDFKFITLFIYLTDVDEDSGPHCYIPKSHDPKFLEDKLVEHKGMYSEHILGNRHAFLNDQTIKSIFSNSEIKTWTGQKGTAFLEDTQGLHKASLPKKSPRLIMQMRWGIKKTKNG